MQKVSLGSACVQAKPHQWPVRTSAFQRFVRLVSGHQRKLQESITLIQMWLITNYNLEQSVKVKMNLESHASGTNWMGQCPQDEEDKFQATMGVAAMGVQKPHHFGYLDVWLPQTIVSKKMKSHHFDPTWHCHNRE